MNINYIFTSSSPGSLTVSEITTTSGKLSWTASSDNVGVTGYNIYQIGVGLIGTVYTQLIQDILRIILQPLYQELL